jgi:formylglycine-generating enzyme required for sulfatase activity
MSNRRLILRLTVLIAAGLLAHALSAAKPKPTAEGAEEKEETFDYTIEGQTKYGTGKVVTLDLGGGVMMEFVRIPHGTFLMGSPDSNETKTPQHEVQITKDFCLSAS